MTPEAMNRAIAEWCGWVRCSCGECGAWFAPGCEEPVLGHPDYYRDLNAVHEAVSRITTWEEQKAFVRALWKVAAPKGIDDVQWAYWPMTHATAAQRAEALLRTIGKWEDSQ